MTSLSGPSFANFDLYVYNYNGEIVMSSTSSYNSIELIRFNATTTSKYTVEIKRKDSGSTTERISLAHVRD